MILKTRLAKRLQQRIDTHTYRVKTARDSAQGAHVSYAPNQRLLSFCSNDYLGLANHPDVVRAFKSGVDQFGVGSGSAALVSGRCTAHHALEEEIAAFLNRPAALLFSTGYMANLGVISTLLTRKDHLFQDRLNHASLMEAAILSRANHYRFAHGNTAQLKDQLNAVSTQTEAKLIVSDGVFSTNGDIAPIPTLVDIAQAHQAWLMIDDAHGIGCLGETGQGVIEHHGIQTDHIDILSGTLGKAFGGFGAFVTGSELLIDSLTQFAKPYIYTTALPAALIEAMRTSLQLIINEPWRRTHLQALIQQFQQGMQSLQLNYQPSITPIQSIVLGCDDKAQQASEALLKKGFLIKAFRTPTVPKGKAALRITLTANHTPAHIDLLLEALSEINTST